MPAITLEIKDQLSSIMRARQGNECPVTFAGWVRDARNEGMTSDKVRQLVRERLGWGSIPPAMEVRISEAFEEVTSVDSNSVAQNIKWTLETRPSNSRPPSVSTDQVVTLAKKCEELTDGIDEMCTLAHALARNLDKQKRAAADRQ